MKSWTVYWQLSIAIHQYWSSAMRLCLFAFLFITKGWPADAKHTSFHLVSFSQLSLFARLLVMLVSRIIVSLLTWNVTWCVHMHLHTTFCSCVPSTLYLYTWGILFGILAQCCVKFVQHTEAPHVCMATYLCSGTRLKTASDLLQWFSRNGLVLIFWAALDKEESTTRGAKLVALLERGPNDVTIFSSDYSLPF